VPSGLALKRHLGDVGTPYHPMSGMYLRNWRRGTTLRPHVFGSTTASSLLQLGMHPPLRLPPKYVRLSKKTVSYLSARN
jgi:hypothetical protein